MKKITNFLMIACLALFSWQGFAQNGGDDCASAVVALEGAFTATQINDVSGGINGGDSAWFVYTATTDGLLNVNACEGGADTRLFIFDACGGTLLATNDDFCAVTPGGSAFASQIDGFAVSNGTDYFIQWDDRWSDGPFDWSIALTPVACSSPTGVGVTTTGTDTADAAWTAAVFGSPSYDWEVVPTGNAQGTGVVVNGNEPTTAVSITGLTENTTYDFYISSDCDGIYVGPTTFTTDAACLAPTGLTETNVDATSTDITFTDANGVGVSTGWNYELLDITAGEVAGGGTTGTTATTTINLTGLTDGGNNYQINITTDCSGAASPGASISWAQGIPAGTDCASAIVALEGTITGTQIFDASGGTNDGDSAWFVYTATADGSLNVNACSGGSDTRLFIFDACGGTLLATNDDSCEVAPGGSAFASEIDGLAVTNGTDYFIQWDDRWNEDVFDWSITLESCLNPDDAAVNPTGADTADGTWTASLGATSYDWEVVPTGNAQGTGVVDSEAGNTSLMADITGLTADTTYDFYIKSDCETVYAGPITFTTLSACSFPIDQAVTGIIADLATLGWTEANTPASASFDYEVVDVTAGGVPTGTPTGNVTTNTVDLTGLVVGNDYQFLVRSICPAGLGTVISEWSPAFDWVQTEAPGCVTDLLPADGSTVAPGSVATSWTAPATGGVAETYDIFFGTDPLALNLLGNTALTAINITGVAPNSTFYLQIVAKNAGGDAVGCTVVEFFTDALDAGGVDCATAAVVTDGAYVTQIIDTGGAANSGDSQWFTYTATLSGSLDVNSCNGGSDTRLSIWNDCASAGPFVVGPRGNDDACATGDGSTTAFASQLVLDVIAGEDYFIQWDDRWDENVFAWSITLTAACPGGITTWDGTAWDNGTPDNTMEAILEGAYDTTTHGDLDVCVLTVKASATVDAGGFARADGNINVTADGDLTVAHTGSVVQVDDAAAVINEGAMSVGVDTPSLTGTGFVVLGSPMADETRETVWASAFNVQAFDTAAFTPNPDVQASGVAYNFAGVDFTEWSPATGTLNSGEGYLVRPQDSYGGAGGVFSYDYNGTIANGVVTQTLGFNTTQLDSPNILSNPYASAIDADLFLAANAEVDALYFWNHITEPSASIPGSGVVNYSMDDISIYNNMGGMASANGGDVPTNVVSTAQGFGVFASAAGTATFNNSMRLTTGNTTLRTPDADRNRIWLNIANAQYSVAGNTLVGFTNNATSGFDRGYDNTRIGTAISLYSHITNGDDGYSIQGREAFNSDMEISLGFSTIIDASAEYVISIADLDGLAWDTNNIFLVDNELNTITQLDVTNYVFTSEGGTFNDRFTVVFQNNALGTGDNALSTVSMYPNPSSDIVTIASPNAAISLIEVTDIRGRVVLTQSVSAQNIATINVANLDTAVYLVSITTESGSITNRLIKE